MLLSVPALVLLALAQPIPLYVAALALTGVATGMGYPLAGVAIQTALPPEHSAEGTSVLLTVLTAFGGIGVVAATGVIEAVGNQTDHQRRHHPRPPPAGRHPPPRRRRDAAGGVPVCPVARRPRRTAERNGSGRAAAVQPARELDMQPTEDPSDRFL
jgi:hypothetical protein